MQNIPLNIICDPSTLGLNIFRTDENTAKRKCVLLLVGTGIPTTTKSFLFF